MRGKSDPNFPGPIALTQWEPCVIIKFVSRMLVTGRSAVWLARLPWEQEAGGSNPLAPTTFTDDGSPACSMTGGTML